MTDAEWLDEVEARTNKATPGPWEYDGMHNEIQTPYGDFYWLIVSECRSAPDQPFESDEFGHSFDHNFEFIAHAREDMPRLIELARKGLELEV